MSLKSLLLTRGIVLVTGSRPAWRPCNSYLKLSVRVTPTVTGVAAVRPRPGTPSPHMGRSTHTSLGTGAPRRAVYNMFLRSGLS